MIAGVPEGTSEWVKARVGLVTASRLGAVTKKNNDGEYSAARRKYMIELIDERMTGRASDHYVTDAMQFGRDQEPNGKAAYEVLTGNLIEPAGFILHKSIGEFGATPDGLIEGGGCFELKCPTSTTHLEWILGRKVPTEYKAQMLGEMACTGRKWCDFASYDPRVPDKIQLFVRRFEPKAEELEEIEAEVQKFLREFDAMWHVLTTVELS